MLSPFRLALVHFRANLGRNGTGRPRRFGDRGGPRCWFQGLQAAGQFGSVAVGAHLGQHLLSVDVLLHHVGRGAVMVHMVLFTVSNIGSLVMFFEKGVLG